MFKCPFLLSAPQFEKTICLPSAACISLSFILLPCYYFLNMDISCAQLTKYNTKQITPIGIKCGHIAVVKEIPYSGIL